MESEAEALEEKLTSLLSQLRAECAILERVVHKNKNQHRRSSYFQYLMKVRRDLKLLQSTKLEEILGCCFQSITGKRPKQKVHLLESLKRRKCESGKYNFMERLLGAARLLSQMVEPMLKAAIQISTLLAQTFFMGFSLTILALLARLRVLVQQILLDVVSVFNMVSSLSEKKQSVKINHEGIEVFREFYPTQEEFITLECVWNSDKFELLERTHKSQIACPGGDLSLGTPSVIYQSVESSLGDDENMSEGADASHTVEHDHVQVMENKIDLLSGPSDGDDVKQVEPCGEGSNMEDIPSKGLPQEVYLPQIPCSQASKLKSGPVKVAFVQVKKPIPSSANTTGIPSRETDKISLNEEEPLFSLLSSSNVKNSLF
ncbi:uncharacterized protein LOC126786723 [Argentina anserina]|uniref:uncharacterized protein LOC126786723 n=1 Tax=Argentina anserina TaxID=57926 RepID=UPI00217668F3|nr:uncharacterized protein LOC126786723 [Potentilla anserina]XP_050368597.1 uncharacterized protein LOC126786723 [Potentilla anserina]XP_050368598.1 uncharacterized protein LOC126786723 [Potentilla anserina]XP_050368599.1 uncharacterized protein LOC126786723 [Potentilla anserina]